MQRPIRLALGFFVVIAVVVAIFVVFQVTSKPVTPAVMTSIGFVQNQAVPNFSDTEHTVTNAAQITEFEALAAKYNVDLAHFNTAQNDVCTGGLGTTITLKFDRLPTDTVQIYSCSGSVAKGTFVTDATHLFSGWRLKDLSP
jgi:hypothetical protein